VLHLVAATVFVVVAARVFWLFALRRHASASS